MPRGQGHTNAITSASLPVLQEQTHISQVCCGMLTFSWPTYFRRLSSFLVELGINPPMQRYPIVHPCASALNFAKLGALLAGPLGYEDQPWSDIFIAVAGFSGNACSLLPSPRTATTNSSAPVHTRPTLCHAEPGLPRHALLSHTLAFP
jgi:hypothetical protein